MGFLDMLRPKFGGRTRSSESTSRAAPSPPPPSDSRVASEPRITAPAAGSINSAPSRTYTVKAGDTLSKIARTELGGASKYMILFEANRDIVKDPDKIFPGQVLKIPQGAQQVH
jgi:nucleoid-associated protein YgaU